MEEGGVGYGCVCGCGCGCGCICGGGVEGIERRGGWWWNVCDRRDMRRIAEPWQRCVGFVSVNVRPIRVDVAGVDDGDGQSHDRCSDGQCKKRGRLHGVEFGCGGCSSVC